MKYVMIFSSVMDFCNVRKRRKMYTIITRCEPMWKPFYNTFTVKYTFYTLYTAQKLSETSEKCHAGFVNPRTNMHFAVPFLGGRCL